MHKEAAARIARARMTLIMDHVFFGVLVMQLKPVECHVIVTPHTTIQNHTMATDGHHLFYNPDFVMQMSDAFLVGIVAHEALHCAYRHHVRMGNRILEKWNHATDYVINYDLREAHFKLPDWCFYNKAFGGLSSEDVYNKLPDPPKQPGGGGDQPGKGSGNSKGNGNGQGQPSSNGSSSGDGTPDPGKMGGVVPYASPWDKNTIDQEASRWEGIAKQAAMIAKANNAGVMPNFLKRLMEDLEAPRVGWQTVLSNFVDTTSDDEFSWRKLNPRYISMGYKIPTLYSDKLRRIVAVVDTSGSITDQLLKIYAAELSSFLDGGLADILTVIYADVIVHNIQEFERGDEIILDPQGGGGTNFRDAMNKVAEYEDASVCLFFTDLYTIDFGDEPDCPHMWVVYGDPQHYKDTPVPYGEKIYIPMQ